MRGWLDGWCLRRRFSGPGQRKLMVRHVAGPEATLAVREVEVPSTEKVLIIPERADLVGPRQQASTPARQRARIVRGDVDRIVYSKRSAFVQRALYRSQGR